MSKTNNIPRSIAIEGINDKELEIWDAEAYTSENAEPLFGVRITNSDDNLIEILINKDELVRISTFLLRLL